MARRVVLDWNVHHGATLELLAGSPRMVAEDGDWTAHMPSGHIAAVIKKAVSEHTGAEIWKGFISARPGSARYLPASYSRLADAKTAARRELNRGLYP